MKIATDTLKKLIGGLVVLSAASLVFGHVFEYVAGLTRIISLIVTVVLVSWLIVFVGSKLKGKPTQNKTANASSASDNITDVDSEKLDY